MSEKFNSDIRPDMTANITSDTDGNKSSDFGGDLNSDIGVDLNGEASNSSNADSGDSIASNDVGQDLNSLGEQSNNSSDRNKRGFFFADAPPPPPPLDTAIYAEAPAHVQDSMNFWDEMENWGAVAGGIQDAKDNKQINHELNIALNQEIPGDHTDPPDDFQIDIEE